MELPPPPIGKLYPPPSGFPLMFSHFGECPLTLFRSAWCKNKSWEAATPLEKNLDPPICDEKHVSDKKRSGSEKVNDEWDNSY